jgi:hypothetical protein
MSHPNGARKEGIFLIVSESPDPCKTPPANAPVPYSLTADLEECMSVSPDVFYCGKPVVLVDESRIAKVTGDEAGSGGGVKSGCNEGEVQFIKGDETVLVNGKLVVREKDQVKMNKGNTTGRVQFLGGSEPGCDVDGDGKPTKDTNPPLSASESAKAGV